MPRALLTLLLTALLATPARAEPREADPRSGEVFARGIAHLGLSGGWGHGVHSDHAERPRILAVLPQLGVGLTDPLGGAAWYRGNVDLSLEPQLLFRLGGGNGFGGGAALHLRYHFLAADRLIPFLGGGLGMLGLDFDVPRQDDGFNFIVQAGSGVRWMLAERVALTLELRWHHLSNASLRSPNGGIDSGLVLAGVTWFPR